MSECLLIPCGDETDDPHRYADNVTLSDVQIDVFLKDTPDSWAWIQSLDPEHDENDRAQSYLQIDFAVASEVVYCERDRQGGNATLDSALSLIDLYAHAERGWTVSLPVHLIDEELSADSIARSIERYTDLHDDHCTLHTGV